jgi:hypothetical protein
LGVEGTNSNGHGKEIDKEGHMMKLIEKLHKYAQARREFMKIMDWQGEFNLKMLKSLERIENKLGRHYHLSPRHFGKETRSSSSRPLPENTENMERMN